MVIKYLREREGGKVREMECARMRCMDKSTWKLFCHSYLLEVVPKIRPQIGYDKIEDSNHSNILLTCMKYSETFYDVILCSINCYQ